MGKHEKPRNTHISLLPEEEPSFASSVRASAWPPWVLAGVRGAREGKTDGDGRPDYSRLAVTRSSKGSPDCLQSHPSPRSSQLQTYAYARLVVVSSQRKVD